MALHNELGHLGEEAAVKFLLRQGHQILVRNFREGKCEIDIISKQDKIIVFTEVKTRTTSWFGHPEAFVDHKKKRLLQQAAEAFMHRQQLDAEIRFDIVAIIHQNGKMNIEYFKDAFFNLDHEEDGRYH